jgi:AcrR family transcriptional regulator
MSTSLSTRGEARREAVLRVARDVLVEEGYDQFVLRRVAARTEMKLGNLQYYFSTRDDLLEAVIRAEFERDLAALRVATDSADDDLATSAHALVRNWTTGAGSVFATLSLLAFHQDRFRDLNCEIYETFYGRLGVMIERAAGQLPAAELAARTRLITAILDGVAIQTTAALGVGTDAQGELLRRATVVVIEIASGRR